MMCMCIYYAIVYHIGTKPVRTMASTPSPVNNTKGHNLILFYDA